jgi:hypothetical protein
MEASGETQALGTEARTDRLERQSEQMDQRTRARSSAIPRVLNEASPVRHAVAAHNLGSS